MKLKRLMDKKSIDILLMEADKRPAFSEEQISKLEKQYEKGPFDKGYIRASLKNSYRSVLVMISDGILESLKEKDPQYHAKLLSEIKKKKGEAEINFNYIEKKLPLVGVVNSVLGIYKSRNPVNLESFVESLQTDKGAENYNLIMNKGDDEDFTLTGEDAKAVMPFFGLMAIEALGPELKKGYAEMRKALNLS